MATPAHTLPGPPPADAPRSLAHALTKLRVVLGKMADYYEPPPTRSKEPPDGPKLHHP